MHGLHACVLEVHLNIHSACVCNMCMHTAVTVAQSRFLATQDRYISLRSNYENTRPNKPKLMLLLNDSQGVELSVSISLFTFLMPAFTCEALPTLQNGFVNYLTKPSEETTGWIVQAFYSCKKGFKLEGDGNVTCQGRRNMAGKWSIGLNTTCVGKH